ANLRKGTPFVKHTLIVVVFIMLIAPLVAAQSRGRRAGGSRPRAASVEQALLDAERQWAEAFKNRDQQALNRLLADNFIFTDDEGNVYDKEKYVAAVTRAVRVESYTMDDLTARASGGAGVVTGRWTGKMTIDGKCASGAVHLPATSCRAAALR